MGIYQALINSLLFVSIVVSFEGCELRSKHVETERLPWEFIGEISTFGGKSDKWVIEYIGSDDGNPPLDLTMTISYKKDTQNLLISGETCDVSSYSYVTSDVQSFLDIVDYIHAHSDAFFDYKEFSEDEGVSLWESEGYPERFALQLKNHKIDNRQHFYQITRWPDMGNGPIPEVEHVLAVIKGTYRTELLKHPIEMQGEVVGEGSAETTETPESEPRP